MMFLSAGIFAVLDVFENSRPASLLVRTFI